MHTPPTPLPRRGLLLALVAALTLGAVLASRFLGGNGGEGTASDGVARSARGLVDRPEPTRPVPPDPYPGSPGDGKPSAEGRPALHLTGRAVERGGQPLTDAHLRARVEGDGERGGLGTLVTTDAQGRFTWGLGRGARPDAQLEFSTMRRSFELVARVRLPDGGRQDLGDVVFDPPPLVISGRVVDPEGRPVSPVALSVALWSEPTVSRLRAFDDAQGSFELRGAVPAGRLVLTAQHPDRPDVQHGFEVGAQGVVLVMPRRSTYEGRVLLEPQTIARRLRLAARGPAFGDQVWVALDAQGRFEFRVPWKGRSSLELEGSGWIGDPLVLFDDLHLTPDGEPEARLETIDLRERLRVTRLAVKDADGKAVGQLFARDLSGSGKATISAAHAAGEHPLVHAGPPREAMVRADRFREARVLLDGGSQEVVLGRGLPVALSFPGAKLLGAEVELAIWMHPEGFEGNPIVARPQEEVLQVDLWTPGRWVGSIRLQGPRPQESEEEGGEPRSTGQLQRFVLGIADTPEPQHFAVPLDPQTLEHAARLRGD